MQAAIAIDAITVEHDVMMNKPIVTKEGRWLLPIAVWRDGVKVKFETASSSKLSFAYESTDQGKSLAMLDAENYDGIAELAGRYVRAICKSGN
ncbi:MAG: exo-alpha-sialidase [Clostridia bacterium]|nr:exo-alpha-sialidase [Clostridia bacterium]